MTFVCLDFLEIVDGRKLKVEGYFAGDTSAKLDDVVVNYSDEVYELQKVNRNQNQEFLELDGPIDGTCFEVCLRLSSKKKAIRFEDTRTNRNLVVKPNQYTRLSRRLYSYHMTRGFKLSLSKGILYVSEQNTARLMDEIRALISIVLDLRVDYIKSKMRLAQEDSSHLRGLLKSAGLALDAIITIPKSLFVRIVFGLSQTFHKHRPGIWLVSDRVLSAGDNGEYFFRYLQKYREDDSRRVVFVISKKSKDHKRIRSVGEVVNYGSLKHLLLHLESALLISSQADAETLRPFGRQSDRFNDLLKFKFVFLQHGIIRHDLSRWLNRYNRNISLFVTSSEIEYNSILDNPYGYSREEVALTGLPRYDGLSNGLGNLLVLAPTYRNGLIKSKANKDGVRPYDETFKESDYFDFYNRLMNDDRVLESLRANSMSGVFLLHPVFKNQSVDFHQNDLFRIPSYPYEYRDYFKKGAIMVSDHSSVMFDFAYLKKPVLYAHFDEKEFFENHSYDRSNFFSDELDGFGKVCTTFEELVSEIISLIEINCSMPQKYIDRVDNYFEYRDNLNSDRVLQAIQRMQNNKVF